MNLAILTSQILNLNNPLDILNIIDNLENNTNNTLSTIENDPVTLFTGKNGNRTITKIIGISNYISTSKIQQWIQQFKKNYHCNVFTDKDNNINLQGNHIIEISKVLRENNIPFIIKGIV